MVFGVCVCVRMHVINSETSFSTPPFSMAKRPKKEREQQKSVHYSKISSARRAQLSKLTYERHLYFSSTRADTHSHSALYDWLELIEPSLSSSNFDTLPNDKAKYSDNARVREVDKKEQGPRIFWGVEINYPPHHFVERRFFDLPMLFCQRWYCAICGI